MVKKKIASKAREVRAFGAESLRQSLEPALYNAGIALYAGAAKLYSFANRKAALMIRGQRESWKKLHEGITRDESWIWVHASSLGEFEQGRPIIESIRSKHPNYRILLTFFSPSGYEVRKNYAGADLVCYLPFDSHRNAKRFVKLVNPAMAIFVKYEFWRNYLLQLSKHSIPTYLVSAVFRPDQLFFKKSGSWYRAWLRWFWHIFVQDRASKELLKSVGINNVTAAGDTRFDRVVQIRRERKEIPLIQQFKSLSGAPLMMAGSSWPADEDIYADWIIAHPDVRLVIAPHEFDASRLEKLLNRFPGSVLMSQAQDNPSLLKGAKTLIIDCFGLLSSAYAYADFAYVGGGFGAGLHNINEAAAHGIPVIYGPNNAKFIEARELAECGGGIEIKSKEDFGKIADLLAYNPRQRTEKGNASANYIASKIGATNRIIESIFPHR